MYDKKNMVSERLQRKKKTLTQNHNGQGIVECYRRRIGKTYLLIFFDDWIIFSSSSYLDQLS